MDRTRSGPAGKLFKRGGIPAWTSSVFFSLASAAAACAPPFESLHFRASKLLLSGDVRLEARVLPAKEALGDLRACPEGRPCLPTGECVVLLDATTKATLHLSQEVAWIDATTQGVLQTLAARRGRRWRLIRATEDGQHQWTRRPKTKRERKRSVDEWSKRDDRHLSWESAGSGRPRTSGYGLLYQAAALRLDEEGASATLEVYSKGRLLIVTLRAKELVEVDLNLRREEGGKERLVRGARSLRRVVVSGDAVDGDGEESPVGLLGMTSDIELFLEPGTGLPLEVRGKVPKLGELRVRLVEAVLP